MNNPFSQPKTVYKIHFQLNYRSIEKFESFFSEEILGICTYEAESSTIHSKPDDKWSIEIYLAEKPELSDLEKDLNSFAAKHNLNILSEITVAPIEDKDWVKEYEEQQQPIEIGKFFITSKQQKIVCPKNKMPIFIEASRAFGTGDHETTALCINAMELLEKERVNNIFDVGTGSGILSFAAEKIWPKANILACDIEEVSVTLAKDNQRVNNSNIYFYQNNEDDLCIPNTWNASFDLIISNILATPLIALASTFQNLSTIHTKIILSGFLDYQSSDIEKAYRDVGFSVLQKLTQDRWITLVLTRD